MYMWHDVHVDMARWHQLSTPGRYKLKQHTIAGCLHKTHEHHSSKQATTTEHSTGLMLMLMPGVIDYTVKGPPAMDACNRCMQWMVFDMSICVHAPMVFTDAPTACFTALAGRMELLFKSNPIYILMPPMIWCMVPENMDPRCPATNSQHSSMPGVPTRRFKAQGSRLKAGGRHRLKRRFRRVPKFMDQCSEHLSFLDT